MPVTATPAIAPPPVVLGVLADASIAASIYVLVRHGALLRPVLAAGLRGSVLLRFAGEHPPVRVDFRGHEIHVEDAGEGEDRAHDLEIAGRLADVNALIAAPLTGGLPRPTSPRGRAALARLADGRVELTGALGLGRRVLMLLAVDPEAASDTRRARRERGQQRSGPS